MPRPLSEIEQRIIRSKVEQVLLEHRRSRVITGIHFNNPFYAIPSPPPWAVFDPCWACFQAAAHWGKQLSRCRRQGRRKFTADEERACFQIRKRFFESDRAYAHCMDKVYGLHRTVKMDDFHDQYKTPFPADGDPQL